jgi:hypothetical protein
MQLKITAILILGLITLCSSPKDRVSETQNTTELLVQKSPWTFDSYKVIKILNKGNADVNESLLKYWVYNNSYSVKITFNDNGTGTYNDTQKNKEIIFQWTLTENEIDIKLNRANAGALIYKNVEISSTQFKFEKEDYGFDKDKNKVTFYGVYSYK